MGSRVIQNLLKNRVENFKSLQLVESQHVGMSFGLVDYITETVFTDESYVGLLRNCAFCNAIIVK